MPTCSAIVGTAPARPDASQVRLPPASSVCCDSPKERVSHPLTVVWRLVAHPLHHPGVAVALVEAEALREGRLRLGPLEDDGVDGRRQELRVRDVRDGQRAAVSPDQEGPLRAGLATIRGWEPTRSPRASLAQRTSLDPRTPPARRPRSARKCAARSTVAQPIDDRVQCRTLVDPLRSRLGEACPARINSTTATAPPASARSATAASVLSSTCPSCAPPAQGIAHRMPV